MTLKARRYVLMVGVVVSVVSIGIGLVATLLSKREGGPTILAPLLLLPTLVLSLQHVRDLERGRRSENPARSRLQGWLISLFVGLLTIALAVLDVSWLLALRGP